MKRRSFLATLALTAALRSPPAGAASEANLPIVGVLMILNRDDDEDKARVTAFRAGLTAVGWRDGENMRLEFRWYNGNSSLAEAAAAELAGLGVSVIVAAGSPALKAVVDQAPGVNCIFLAVSDPIGQGFVTDLARPGGRITGFSLFEPGVSAKLVEALIEIAPNTRNVGLCLRPGTSSNAALLSGMSRHFGAGLHTTELAYENRSELARKLSGLASLDSSGVVFLPDPWVTTNRKDVLSAVAEARIPAIYPYAIMARAGGLASYGPDTETEQYRRAAEYVDRVLRGENPGFLPIQQPTKFLLTVNIKTAASLGLRLPFSVMARADEVVD